MVSTLWKKKFYTAKINYVTAHFIREYDISKADATVFYSKGIINEDQYRDLCKIPSGARNIQMGLLQREDKQLIKVLSSGIEEARQLFFEANDIQEWQVLSIKNDAIFLIDKVASVTQFGNIVFKQKNTYTSFYTLPKIFNKEFFYYLNSIDNIERLEVKGIDDEVLSMHDGYMNEFFMVLFNSIEQYGVADALDLIQTFYNQYIRMGLELGYYRRYDQRSGFDINIETPILRSRYNIRYPSENDIQKIDISYNASLIREFFKLVSNMYFSNKK